MKRAIPSLMVARYAPTVFSPTNIAGLKVWLKADSLVLSDNDPVSSWADQSGNGNNVAQGTGGFQPLYKTNIQNGLPIVRFDGTDDVLAGTFTITYGSIFTVANFNSGGNFPSYNGLIVTQAGANDSEDYFNGDGSGTTNLYATGATPFGNTTIWVNGVQTINFSPLATIKCLSGTDPTPASKTSLNVGNNPGAAGRFWNGDVAEVIVYDTALSTTDRQRVEAYLSSKWALGF